LIHIINKISSSLDENKITAGVFLDLSKAFDTIDHRILLSKLHHYGISGLALKWIQNYLTNRKQFVHVYGTNSNYHDIKLGIPQGSILGPILFILYINDLPNALKDSSSILFADDTSIFFSHKDIHKLMSTLSNELANVDIWLQANRLSINISKTNYILFKPRQKQINYNISLSYRNQLLERKTFTKFLGIYIDESLTWKPHINYISNKLSKSIGMIYKSSYYLPQEVKLSLYYSLVYPYLTYCNCVWSSTYPSNLNRIFLFQKCIVRIISSSSYLAHTEPLFSKLKILDIFKLYSFFMATFMYKYINKLLPPLFSNIFLHTPQERQLIFDRTLVGQI